MSYSGPEEPDDYFEDYEEDNYYDCEPTVYDAEEERMFAVAESLDWYGVEEE